MRKLLLLALLVVSAIAIPVTVTQSRSSASAATLNPIGWPGYTCTTGHWIKDASNGFKLVGADPSNGYQLTDYPGTFPTDHVFVLCTVGNSGVYYLQNQYPSTNTPGGRLWVGVNTFGHYAITGTATGPGPHEGFTLICTGNHTEQIHWAFQGSDTFTIATEPPTLWTNPPNSGFPGTRYQISGVC